MTGERAITVRLPERLPALNRTSARALLAILVDLERRSAFPDAELGPDATEGTRHER